MSTTSKIGSYWLLIVFDVYKTQKHKILVNKKKKKITEIKKEVMQNKIK